ncbi:hypothetical protein GCM10010193_52540 [Kitasatospora atroaurantiaca]
MTSPVAGDDPAGVPAGRYARSGSGHAPQRSNGWSPACEESLSKRLVIWLGPTLLTGSKSTVPENRVAVLGHRDQACSAWADRQARVARASLRIVDGRMTADALATTGW